MIVDVAILGAGVAGLRAAQVLSTTRSGGGQRPLTVAILEARAVPGGRVRWTQ